MKDKSLILNRISKDTYIGSLKKQNNENISFAELNNFQVINNYNFIQSGYNSELNYLRKTLSQINMLPEDSRLIVRNKNRLIRNKQFHNIFSIILEHYGYRIEYSSDYSESIEQAQNYSKVLSKENTRNLPYGYITTGKQIKKTKSKVKLQNIKIILSYGSNDHTLKQISEMTKLKQKEIEDMIKEERYTGKYTIQGKSFQGFIDQQTYDNNVYALQNNVKRDIPKKQKKDSSKVLCVSCLQNYTWNLDYLKPTCKCNKMISKSHFDNTYSNIRTIYYKKQIVQMTIKYLMKECKTSKSQIKGLVDSVITDLYIQIEKGIDNNFLLNKIDQHSVVYVYDSKKIDIHHNILTENEIDGYHIDKSSEFTIYDQKFRNQVIKVANQLGFLLQDYYKSLDAQKLSKQLYSNLITIDSEIPILDQDKDIYGDVSSSKIQIQKQMQERSIILAPAGSGKSKLINSYANYFIKSNSDNSNILYLSFSRDVNDNFKNRDVTCKTFHKFAIELLDDFYLHEYSYHNTKTLPIHSIRKNYPKDIINNALEVLDYHFNTGINIKKVAIMKGYKTTVDKICNQILTFVKKENCMLLSQCLYEAVSLLTKDEKLRNSIKNKYDLILLDEAQDLNEMQYRLLKLIFNGKIVAVADPFQSIYQFIGSSSTYLFKMYKQFNIQKVFYLNENYRSSQSVIDFTNHFMKSLPSLNYKEMIPIKSITGKVEEICIDMNDLLQTVNNIKANYKEDQITVLSFKNKTLENLKNDSNQEVEYQDDEFYDFQDQVFNMEDGSQYSTIHRFKGLQKKTIIMIIDRNQFNTIEQKYNLFYTAFTRAQQNLYIIKIKTNWKK